MTFLEENMVFFIIQATNSDDPEIIGDYYVLWVKDNGQGKNSEPDEISFWYPKNPANIEELCGDPELSWFYIENLGEFGMESNQVEAGNIKVHKNKD